MMRTKTDEPTVALSRNDSCGPVQPDHVQSGENWGYLTHKGSTSILAEHGRASKLAIVFAKY